jgi:hypothetical protein
MARCGDGMEEGPMLTGGLRREEWRVRTSVEKRLQIELQLQYPLKCHRKQKLSAKEEVAQRK